MHFYNSPIFCESTCGAHMFIVIGHFSSPRYNCLVVHVGLHNHPNAKGENWKVLNKLNLSIKSKILMPPQILFLANLFNESFCNCFWGKTQSQKETSCEMTFCWRCWIGRGNHTTLSIKCCHKIIFCTIFRFVISHLIK
jgi:hypothetical protein